MSGHALAARTLLAAADELVGGPPVEASAAALAGDAAVRHAQALVRAVAESHGVAAVLFAATAAAAAAVDRGDPP